MKKYFLLIVVALFVSCENKEEKAYLAAKNSNSTIVLHNYLSKYGEDAPIEHLNEITQRLNELSNDSVDYEFVLGAADISQKYKAEMNYLNKHPKGLHFKEVDSMMKTDKTAYDEWHIAKKTQEEEEAKKALYEEKYGEYRDNMKNFMYRDTHGYAYAFIFDIPNDKGKGVGGFFWGTTWIKFKYEIHNNGDIYLNYDGIRAIVNMYSDCLYSDFIYGEELRYRRVLIMNDYPEYIKKIRKMK